MCSASHECRTGGAECGASSHHGRSLFIPSFAHLSEEDTVFSRPSVEPSIAGEHRPRRQPVAGVAHCGTLPEDALQTLTVV
jgi:hypothetical protein